MSFCDVLSTLSGRLSSARIWSPRCAKSGSMLRYHQTSGATGATGATGARKLSRGLSLRRKSLCCSSEAKIFSAPRTSERNSLNRPRTIFVFAKDLSNFFSKRKRHCKAQRASHAQEGHCEDGLVKFGWQWVFACKLSSSLVLALVLSRIQCFGTTVRRQSEQTSCFTFLIFLNLV